MVYIKITLSTDLTDIYEIIGKFDDEIKSFKEKGFIIEETLITHKKEELS